MGILKGKVMGKVFHNPIAPKMRKSSRTFIAPTKEQATTGYFMDAGDSYGVGFRVPVGKEKPSGKHAIPMESKCFPSDQAI
jgi:hypothetical protein